MKKISIFLILLLFLSCASDPEQARSNKYLNEELKRNNYGYWTEKYRLYSKCKKIIFNEDKIIIPFRYSL